MSRNDGESSGEGGLGLEMESHIRQASNSSRDSWVNVEVSDTDESLSRSGSVIERARIDGAFPTHRLGSIIGEM
jgi:hypothetical protein